MDVRAANRHSFGNAEIDIDCIVAAVAGLNDKISRLRREIDAFKNEEGNYSVRNCLRPAPSEFNESAENARRRTSARCETQRNFKGDDSLGGSDLSARLSSAERAREVKTEAHEAAVFKEDYPSDDKSIGNDERPDRSPSKPSRASREPISDAEKFSRETDNDEKSQEPERCRNRPANDTYRERSPENVIASKIRRKRISRGVQYDRPAERGRNAGCLFLRCFRPRSKEYKQAREAERKRAHRNKSDIVRERQKRAIRSSVEKIISGGTRPEQSCGSIDEEEIPAGDANLKKETRKGNEEEVRSIKKKYDESQNRDAKWSRLGVPWLCKMFGRSARARRRRSVRNSNPSVVVIDSAGNKEEITETDFGSKGKYSDRERNDGFHGDRSVKFPDCETKSEDARENAAAASERQNNVNEARKRLDLCIAELNGIIRDACAIFGGGSSFGGVERTSMAKRNS
ncbi:hypothetical protein EAI_03390 [Harpegnathos saltator]|uniref:Uncharacterized protein n=2 Tax=Harpegnathos saltator TaxID=610380 RepID=E2BJZ6_HARSA|nr:hypothetical protein EAI_03390 [Harpegnathos saltator]